MKVDETFVQGSQPWVQSLSCFYSIPSCGIELLPEVLVPEGAHPGAGWRWRWRKGNPTNGVTRQRAVLCLWNHWRIGCEEELRPRRIRERPWTWESVTPGLYTQLAHSKPVWPETSYLISLGLCFVTSKYELIPVFQGRRDQVIEHMEKYLVQSRQSVTVRASSLQFAQSQPCYP